MTVIVVIGRSGIRLLILLLIARCSGPLDLLTQNHLRIAWIILEIWIRLAVGGIIVLISPRRLVLVSILVRLLIVIVRGTGHRGGKKGG